MKDKYLNVPHGLCPMAACIVNADHCQIELYNDHVGRLYVGHSRAEKRGAAKI